MKYIFLIEEKAIYVQTGTVTVEADNGDQAMYKVSQGDYKHLWGNEIDLNSEQLLSTTITEQIYDTESQDLPEMQ